MVLHFVKSKHGDGPQCAWIFSYFPLEVAVHLDVRTLLQLCGLGYLHSHVPVHGQLDIEEVGGDHNRWCRFGDATLQQAWTDNMGIATRRCWCTLHPQDHVQGGGGCKEVTSELPSWKALHAMVPVPS